jgi:hypothetical protein
MSVRNGFLKQSDGARLKFPCRKHEKSPRRPLPCVLLSVGGRLLRYLHSQLGFVPHPTVRRRIVIPSTTSACLSSSRMMSRRLRSNKTPSSWRLVALAVVCLLSTCVVGSASGDSVDRPPQHHELAVKEGSDRISPMEASRTEEKVGQPQRQHRELFNMWNLLFMCTSILPLIVRCSSYRMARPLLQSDRLLVLLPLAFRSLNQSARIPVLPWESPTRTASQRNRVREEAEAEAVAVAVPQEAADPAAVGPAAEARGAADRPAGAARRAAATRRRRKKSRTRRAGATARSSPPSCSCWPPWRRPRRSLVSSSGRGGGPRTCTRSPAASGGGWASLVTSPTPPSATTPAGRTASWR